MNGKGESGGEGQVEDRREGRSEHPGDGPLADDARSRLARESGVLPWSELVRHFARGVVVKVHARVELLDVAACLVENDTTRLQAWLDAGSVARASDDDARDWNAREPEFLCVVTAPWVLVQERGD